MKQVDTKNSRYIASVGHDVRDRAVRCQATSKPTIAELKMSTAATRAWNTKPTYELIDLEPLEPLAPPAAGEQK